MGNNLIPRVSPLHAPWDVKRRDPGNEVELESLQSVDFGSFFCGGGGGGCGGGARKYLKLHINLPSFHLPNELPPFKPNYTLLSGNFKEKVVLKAKRENLT